MHNPFLSYRHHGNTIHTPHSKTHSLQVDWRSPQQPHNSVVPRQHAPYISPFRQESLKKCIPVAYVHCGRLGSIGTEQKNLCRSVNMYCIEAVLECQALSQREENVHCGCVNELTLGRNQCFPTRSCVARHGICVQVCTCVYVCVRVCTCVCVSASQSESDGKQFKKPLKWKTCTHTHTRRHSHMKQHILCQPTNI